MVLKHVCALCVVVCVFSFRCSGIFVIICCVKNVLGIKKQHNVNLHAVVCNDTVQRWVKAKWFIVLLNKEADILF